MATDDAVPGPSPTPFQLVFKGDAGEYFRIWIVNLALTIVTVGIYSAWAKVRKQRYFHGNTYLADSAFGYHADPIRILKGRIIAGLIVAVYFLALRTSAAATSAVVALVALLTPWLVVKSRRFTARVTSWRGLRFNFKADYAGAYKVLLGWLVVGVLTLGLLMPRLSRERYRFLVTRSAYGNTEFACNPSIGRFYKTVFGAIGIAICITVVVAIPIALAKVALQHSPVASPHLAKALPLISLFLNYAILAPVLLGYTQSRNLNEVLNHTTLGPHRFTSTLSARKLAGIYIGNVFAIVATLGLLTPWAQIRLARYRAQCVTLLAAGALESFTGEPVGDIPSATSEELSSFLDLDFGF